MKKGTNLVRVIVEEFASTNYSEITLPVEYQRMAHACFETFGLDKCFQLSLEIFKEVHNIFASAQLPPHDHLIDWMALAQEVRFQFIMNLSNIPSPPPLLFELVCAASQYLLMLGL